MSLPEPGHEISHYRLLDRIGEGGMGVVYKALDTRLHRHVALKVLRPELTVDPDRRQRFLREARAAAAVNHPGIATIHEIDHHGDITFIVMELVEGRTLRSLISGDPMPVGQAVHVAAQVAEAMARAHEARVIHRDLKPDNIMVAPDLRARILDFGLALLGDDGEPGLDGTHDADVESAVTRDLEQGRRLLGTVSYMSPEQARGDPLDPRSDIFSFGVVMYEMLSGRRPFAGASITATLAKILEAEPEALGDLRPDLPPWLQAIVEKCLRKNPGDRYATAAAVARDLRDARRLPVPATETPVSQNTIAVLPFSFRGSREYSYLSAGLVDLLSTKLDGAGDLRSVDPHVILCCVEAGGSVIDPELGRSTARRYGAGLFVLGGVFELGGQLQLEASLYGGAETATVLSKAAVRGEATRIFEMVDQLTAELLSRMPGGPGARLTRIASVSTDSFEALKAYLEGEAEMRAMRRLAAVGAYRRAVEQDPSFGLAWYRLSVAALWSGQSHLAHEAAARAVQHGSRLSGRDRDVLEAFHASLLGRNDEAETRYRAILGEHPDDVEAWYQLGELQMHCGPLRGRPIAWSREAWQRLISLDPNHVNGWAHLGLIATHTRDAEALETCMERVLQLSPSGDSASWARAFSAYTSRDPKERATLLEDLALVSDYDIVHAVWALGAYTNDHAAAIEIAGLLVEPVRSPDTRGLGHIVRASLEMARGRWSLAARELDLARSWDPGMAALHRAHLAAAPYMRLSVQTLASIQRELESVPPESRPAAPRPAWIGADDGLHARLGLYLAGLLEARQGRTAEALAAGGALEALGEPPESGSLVPDLIASLRAHAAVAAGDPEGALAMLESTRLQSRFDLTIWSPFYSQALPRFLRAELLSQAGRDEESLCWLDSFGGNSIYEQPFLAPSHLRRAEIAERLGRSAEAADHYTRFVELWGSCDEESRPLVAQARERAHRLRGLS